MAQNTPAALDRCELSPARAAQPAVASRVCAEVHRLDQAKQDCFEWVSVASDRFLVWPGIRQFCPPLLNLIAVAHLSVNHRLDPAAPQSVEVVGRSFNLFFEPQANPGRQPIPDGTIAVEPESFE